MRTRRSLEAGLWLWALTAAAQCTNPATIPDETIAIGTKDFMDANALKANLLVVTGSATVKAVAGNCIHLANGFQAHSSQGAQFQAWIDTVPAAVYVEPNSGAAPASSGFLGFTWKASSPLGATHLTDLYMIFHPSSASGQNACYIRYYRSGNYLKLADNAGTNWGAPITPGSTTMWANSQCRVWGQGSSYSIAGNELTVTVAIEFLSGFSGTKKNFLKAIDAENLNSGWQEMGWWTVGSLAPPSISSLLPPSQVVGYPVTIYGNNFGPSQASSTVRFYNGVVAGQVNSWDNGSIQVLVPSGAATGPVTVTVAGTQSNPQNFTVGSPPTLTITTATPLPSGEWTAGYSPVTLAATGGTPPYSWSVDEPPTHGNLLPSGLSLSAAGVLSGTPTRGGQSYGFWITVTDSIGAAVSKNFTLAVGPPVQTIAGPSRLEAGLSYVPFNEYDYAHLASSKFPYSCPPGSSIRSCFQTVLAELRAQGVSGVRIFFGLCDSESSPLANCGQDWTQVYYQGNVFPADRSWIDRVKDFFHDVKNAGIQNITLTPVHDTDPTYSKPKAEVRTPASPPPPQPPVHCWDAPDTIYFNPESPFGFKHISGDKYYPIGEALEDNNLGYNCAPINPYFVGWQNQYDVIDAMLAAAAEKQLTVSELDFEQELHIMLFPALARFIVDNAHGDSGQPNVTNALRYYMDLHGFDSGRVTWAAPWSSSTLAGANCTSVYGGYARTMGADQIASAIGGGFIGIPTASTFEAATGYLRCYGNTSQMFPMPTYGTQPSILDVHLRPCVGTADTHCVLNDAEAAVESEAKMDFDDIVNFLARFPSTTTVMLGETHSNTDNGAGGVCEGGTLNAPAETVAGYNLSALPGTSVVFRPWIQLQSPSGDCFKYPGNQRVNFLGGGPYRPTQQ